MRFELPPSVYERDLDKYQLESDITDMLVGIFSGKYPPQYFLGEYQNLENVFPRKVPLFHANSLHRSITYNTK